MSKQAPAPYAYGPPPQAPYAQQAPAPQWPGYPQAPPAPSPAPYATPIIGECEHCKGHVKLGEPAVELFPGVAGVSRQTGQMLVEAPPNTPSRSVTVHMKRCLLEYVLNEIAQDESDDIIMEMANEMIDERIGEFVEDRGITWSDVERILDQAGYPSQEALLEGKVNGDD